MRTAMKRLILIAVVFWLAAVQALADDVTGCPLGLKKGEFWVKSWIQYVRATRALWSDSPQERPEMVSLPDNWHSRITISKLRLGYGITSRLDVGILLPYFDKHTRKEAWKTNSKAESARQTKELRGRGLGDIWLSAKYKIIDNTDNTRTIEALALGVGFKFDSADDSLVKKGIGSGAKALRVCLLSHERLGRLDFCNHIFYEWRGRVRGIRFDKPVLMPGSKPRCVMRSVLWPKSGIELGDKIGYKFNVEYPFAAKWAVHLGALGWHRFDNRDRGGWRIADSHRFEHSIMPKIVFHPGGVEEEHKKIFLGLVIPYKSRKDLSAAVTPMLCMMWTF